MPPSKRQKFIDLLASVEAAPQEQTVQVVQDQRDKLIEQWTLDPWAFLTGRDLDGRPVYWTKDERSNNALRPFPDWPYLGEFVRAMHGELVAAGDGHCRTILSDKARQMMVSTTILAFFNWNCMFNKGRRWLVSKVKEREAQDLIRDKVRVPSAQMPEWLRAARGCTKTPQVRIDYPWSGSHILAVSEDAADGEFRGGTSTGGLIDEAARQKQTKAIYEAATPQASLMFLVTTPNLGNEGATAFKDMALIDKPERRRPAKEYRDSKGISFWRTPKGYLYVRLEYFARPDKDKTWADEEKSRTSPSAWRRENELDWSSSAGKVYYPEFCARPKAFIRPVPGMMNQPVLRCFDFGFNNPAVVTLQYDPFIRRAWVQRELKPTSINTYAFAALVRYLCGEVPIEALEEWERALEIVGELQEAHDNGDGPAVPWYAATATKPIQFLNFCGHESNKNQSAAADMETKATTDGTIMEASGIAPMSWAYVYQVRREAVIRKLLSNLPDGHPGILFDPIGCPILIEGFGGGIVYPDATPANPDPSDPKKDNKYSHLHEALGYGLVQYIPLVEKLALQSPEERTFNARREPMEPFEDEGFDISLARNY